MSKLFDRQRSLLEPSGQNTKAFVPSGGRRRHIMAEPSGHAPTKAPFAAYVDYTKDLELFKTEKPYELYQVENLARKDTTNVEYELHDISGQLEDVRGRESDLQLEKDSFCYMKFPSSIPISAEEHMIYPYAEEVNELLKGILKTPHVVCYDVRVSSLHWDTKLPC